MKWLTNSLLLLGMAVMLALWSQGCAHKMPIVEAIETPSNSILGDELKITGSIKLLPEKETSDYYVKIFSQVESNLNQLLKSEAFKDEFLKANIDIQQNNPTDKVKALKTNLDAYNYIVSQSPVIGVAFYSHRLTSAVAYREGNTIYFNLSKIGGWDVSDFTSTAFHESMHVIGFDHYFENIPARAKSLPYMINQITEKLL